MGACLSSTSNNNSAQASPKVTDERTNSQKMVSTTIHFDVNGEFDGQICRNLTKTINRQTAEILNIDDQNIHVTITNTSDPNKALRVNL